MKGKKKRKTKVIEQYREDGPPENPVTCTHTPTTSVQPQHNIQLVLQDSDDQQDSESSFQQQIP